MNLSKFNDDDFDVKDWINSAFRLQPATTDKREAYASVLVNKLQFLIKEANRALEENSTQVVANVTRVLRDVDAVKQEAALLKSQMEAVQEQIESVELETQHSMQVLVELDRVKSRVEQARGALEEANKWSTLVQAVELKFSENDVQGVAEQIAHMKASLHILKDAPDYHEKNQLLSQFKNQAETWISPRVFECFNTKNHESAVFLLKIHRQIDREDSFKSSYYSCQRAKYASQWNTIKAEIDNDKKLGEFYSYIQFDSEKEEVWLKGLLGGDDAAARDMILTLMVRVCQDIQHDVSDILKRQINACDDDVESLDVIILNSKHVVKFAKFLKVEACSPLMDPIMKPFVPHLYNFGKMIQQKLYIQLNEIQIDDENFTDSLHKLQTSIELVFTRMFSAIDICDELTGGLAINACLSSCNNFLSKYALKCSLFMKMMRKKWKAGTQDNPKDILSESDAWRAFSDSIQLISTTGDLILALERADEQVCATIIEIAERYFSNDGFISLLEVPNTDRYNYLKKDDVQKLQELATATVAAVADEGGDEKMTTNLPLHKARQEFLSLNQQAVDLAYAIVVSQVKHQFRSIASKNIWADEAATEGIVDDMPEMGVIPQEYVTKVGEFILTLPQHLEPLAEVEESADSSVQGLSKALNLCSLPIVDPEEVCGGAEWLESLVKSTEKELVDAFLKIPKLTTSAGVQLKADIEYMCNVTDSLGIEPLPILLDVRTLASAKPGSFFEQSEECDKKAISAIAKMRGLESK